jgi:protein SCO1/2
VNRRTALRLGGGGAAALALGIGARQPAPAPDPAALPWYDGPDFTPRWEAGTHRVGSFRLVSQETREVTEADLDGRIHVASFLFTTCASVCPTLVARLRRVQEAARAWPDVLLVSYSVTPALDTPEVLAEFGRLRGIEPARWRLLTGDPATIVRLARESYFATDERDGGGERLVHSEKVLLVDRARRLRGLYDGTRAFEVERLVEDIARLRAETV